LSVFAVGAATTVIGLAELTGEMLTAFLGDRLGLLRVILTATLLSAASYLAMPFFADSLPFALAALFCVFVSVECAIVTALSLYTEVLPTARATMMSGHMAAASLGRVTGALMGGPLWLMGGIRIVGIVSACITGLGIVALLWGLWGWRPDGPDSPDPQPIDLG